MNRVLVVARAELLALVRTKFFVIGIISMPLLGAVVFSFLSYAERHVDRQDRRIAVVDRTGLLFDVLSSEAVAHNSEMGEGVTRTGPYFYPVLVDPAGRTDDQLAEDLSERVRHAEFFAFVLIPAEVIHMNVAATIKYYSESTAYQNLPNWLQRTLAREIERRRFEALGVDARLVPALTARAELSTFNLVQRRPDGTIAPPRKVDNLQRSIVPFFFLVLMFMAVMSNAQHLIHTIIEEKMSKISEVLLGSISAFELLMGKLLGVVAVSFLLAFVYLGIGIYAALNLGRPDLIDPALIGWFLLFLVCASLAFGALFQALSSACSDLKDAQSMLQPAMMVVIAAYLVSFLVLRAPDSPLAIAMSFVPIFTPFAMLLRIAMPPGPPLWHILLAVAILITTTGAIVWAAARIFRVGLLMQGKPPTLPELLRWIRQ